jgi:hypothetical protein
VIAGENDTGKSTVGKLLYAIIKTFNRYERDAKVFRVKKLENFIDQYYFESRKKFDNVIALKTLKELFDELKNEVLRSFDGGHIIAKEDVRAIFAARIENFTEIIRTVSGVEVSLEDLPGRLVELIQEEPAQEDILKNTFRKYCLSLFEGGVANTFIDDAPYAITGWEGKTKIFDLSGRNDQLAIHLEDKLYFEDATFIESPVILNMADTIRFAKTEFDRNGEARQQAEWLEKGYVPDYMKDLILKLTEQTGHTDVSNLQERINAIIGGHFYYHHEERNFIFEKGNRSFKGKAIAQGIKSMGMIGLLKQTGFLKEKNLLILDEPENHMHPKWQIRFMEVLVQLVKEGIHIILTTHSPYLVESLKVYSDKAGLKDKTAFCLGEHNKKAFTSRIIEVSENISPIFDLLVEPYDELEVLQETLDGMAI